MLAEALVLAGLAAALRGNPPWHRTTQWHSTPQAHSMPQGRASPTGAVGCMLAAAALHPLMALAGVGALYCLYVGETKPVVAVALVIVAVKAMALMAYGMPLGPWGRFDAAWLALVQTRSPYLFLRGWSLPDWTQLGVTITTLCLAYLAFADGQARRLARLSALTALTGVALTGIGCDLLHLVLLTQLQPWRCQWLATVVAALVLPELLVALWRARGRGRGRGRAAASLLLSAWLFGSDGYALAACAAALLAWLGIPHLRVGEARWIGYGATAFLLLAGVWRLASNLLFTSAHYFEPTVPLWLRDSMSFTRDGSVPIALLLLVGWLTGRPAGPRPALTRGATAALGVAALASCAILAPSTLAAWTSREFPASRTAPFAGWRERIAPQATVFWPESPLAVWLLLDRPSYLSVLQTSGLVFSRASAREFERRATALSTAVSRDAFLNFDSGTGLSLSRAQLQTSCASGAFDYLVTAADLGMAPVAVVSATTAPLEVPARSARPLRLYQCRTARPRG
jgi:hypothetical protein